MSVAESVTSTSALTGLGGHISPRTSAPRLADFTKAHYGDLISRRVFGDLVRATDFLLAVATGLVIAALYVKGIFTTYALGYGVAIVVASAALVTLCDYLGLYRVSSFLSIVRNLPRLFVGWVGAIAVLAAGVFFFKVGEEFSRVWLATWFVVGLGVHILARIAVAGLTRHWAETGRLYRRAVVFGGCEAGCNVIDALEADIEADVRICGIFDERHDQRVPAEHEGYPVLGSLADLVAMARTTRIDLVIVALPLSAEKRIAEVSEILSELPVEVKLPADASRVRFASRTYSRVGSVAMLDLIDRPIVAWGGVAKWLFDKTVAALALVLLAPVMAAVALAVRLESRGPVLFRQKRYGFNNELVEVFKFRSMYIDKCDAAAAKLVTKEDPRVTRVGRFIRKTSLDELPQLFNVLLGTLSLVGPRPHAVAAKAGSELYDDVVSGYFKRHKVKPGITGWAQINGWRGETDTHEKIQKRVEHDIYYIENWSIFFDLYILIKTPLALLKSENAY
ncbi:MAG: undecaprenyl-phosphate glucose phosphotransferase [Filomicrobium sp.]